MTRLFTGGNSAAEMVSAVMVVAMVLFLAVPAATEPPDPEEPNEEQQEETDEPAAQEPEVPPRFYLLPVDSVEGEVTDIVTRRINDAVRERFENLGGLELLPTFEAMQGGAGSEATAAALREAESQYTSGIGLVNAGQYQEAVETLQMAVNILEDNIADLDDLSILTDAKAHLAVAYHQTGFDLDARDTIEHFAHLNPDADLDPDLYPDELRRLYDEEVQRVKKAGDGHLNIEADRDGARVYIDTEYRGQTPMTVEDVGFGERYLVVTDGDMQWSGVIQVRARGQQQDIDVELQDPDDVDSEDELPGFYVDLRRILQSGQFDTGLQPYLAELASQTGADYIAWVLVMPEGREYGAMPFVYRDEDGTIMQSREVTFDRQLTGIRATSNEIADGVATATVFIPENQIVTDVDLVGEPDDDEPRLTEEERMALEEQLDGEPDAEEDPAEEPSDDTPEMVRQQDDEPVAMTDDEEPAEGMPVPDQAAGQGMGAPVYDDSMDERDNTMRYLGWGSLAVATTGAVATTVFLLMQRDSPAPGFEVEVEW